MLPVCPQPRDEGCLAQVGVLALQTKQGCGRSTLRLISRQAPASETTSVDVCLTLAVPSDGSCLQDACTSSGSPSPETSPGGSATGPGGTQGQFRLQLRPSGPVFCSAGLWRMADPITLAARCMRLFAAAHPTVRTFCSFCRAEGCLFI